MNMRRAVFLRNDLLAASFQAEAEQQALGREWLRVAAKASRKFQLLGNYV